MRPRRSSFPGHMTRKGRTPIWPSAADRPGAGAGGGVEERGAVVLLRLGSRGGVAAAAHRFPGPVVELVFAAISAVGGDRRRVAARLTGADRFQRPHRDAEGGKPFLDLPLPPKLGGAFVSPDVSGNRLDDPVKAMNRPPQLLKRRHFSLPDAGAGLRPLPAGSQSGRGKNKKDEQDRGELFAFCKQAQNREG